MHRRSTLPLCALAAVSFLLAPIAAAGQPADESWTVPRTADGRPDLQGVWANNAATPLERPAQLADRAAFTDEEVASLAAAAERLFGSGNDAGFADGVFNAALAAETEHESVCVGTGNYGSVWMVDRDFDNRTSLITRPSSGRLPALTPAAAERQAAARAARRQRTYDGPEDLPLQSRCITFGMPRVGGLGAGYNETTNFDPRHSYRGATDNLHLVERLTRVGPEAMHYEITVTDPTTWQSPWTALVILRKSEDAVYEYACHEGNYGMEGILAGARAAEVNEQ